MAREAQDREDLLRDATAFTTRVQLRVVLGDQPVVVFAGFRTGGAASVYFDQDPVYHFNAAGELRRAFVGDLLIKAEAGRLVRWQRRNDEDEVAMLRDEMSDVEQDEFCRAALQQLDALRKALADEQYEVEGQVSTDGGAIDLVAEFLAALDSIKVADSPRVAG